jgi:hypothetical protein
MSEPLPANPSGLNPQAANASPSAATPCFLIGDDDAIRRSLACATCEHDLRGLRRHDACPECATPVQTSIERRLREARLRPDGSISAGICQACRYDLRGVHFDAACPECGEPVRRSIYTDDARYDNPQWLRRIMIGAGLVATGVSLVIGLVALAIASMSTLIFCGSPFIVLILAAGVWLFTTPHPLLTPRAASDANSRAARWTLLVPLAVIGAMATTQLRGLFTIGLGSLVLIALVIGTTYFHRALAEISRRASPGDPAPAPAATPARRVLTLGPAALAIIGAILISWRAGAPSWTAGVGKLLWTAAAGWYVLLLAGVAVYSAELATRISKLLPDARRNWPDGRPIGPPETAESR